MALSTGLRIFFGTYTSSGNVSRGIYSASLDAATGELSEPVLAAETSNPTFLAWHPRLPVLYSLGEHGAVQGKAGGALVSFQYDAASGRLNRLNSEATGGMGLAHLNADATGRSIVTVSYHGGYVASFPLREDGSLAARTSVISHTGQLGPNPKRQEKPHPHAAIFSPDNRFCYVCDLGLDGIYRYQLDPVAATLSFAGENASMPGAGPRHGKFSSDGKFLYIINELNGTIEAFGVNVATGDLTRTQVISTLPTGFSGENICAEIHLSPDERFVYGSNRGHDSLAVFGRDPANGALRLVEIVPTGGKHPRNFNLSPDGRWLVCANKDSDSVTTFARDATTGRLRRTAQTLQLPQAVCVVFAADRG